jgi:hypothetical protein
MILPIGFFIFEISARWQQLVFAPWQGVAGRIFVTVKSKDTVFFLEDIGELRVAIAEHMLILKKDVTEFLKTVIKFFNAFRTSTVPP